MLIEQHQKGTLVIKCIPSNGREEATAFDTQIFLKVGDDLIHIENVFSLDIHIEAASQVEATLGIIPSEILLEGAIIKESAPAAHYE